MKAIENQILNINKAQIIALIEGLLQSLETLNKNLAPHVSQDTEKLYIKTYKGETYFTVSNKGQNPISIGKDDKDKISLYAQNTYNAKLFQVSEREIKQLKVALETLKYSKRGCTDINEVYNSLPEAIKPFVNPDPLDDESYARRWQEDRNYLYKRRNNQPDKYHISKTQNGEYATSKSEVIIANILKDRGIPYHYEVAITPESVLDASRPVFETDAAGMPEFAGYEALPQYNPFSQDTLHPDFIVLNKRTRKTYFWEHMGKLDDPEYCRKNLNRLVRFFDAGYEVGRDIILTHETGNAPLDTEEVNRIIDRFLV